MYPGQNVIKLVSIWSNIFSFFHSSAMCSRRETSINLVIIKESDNSNIKINYLTSLFIIHVRLYENAEC